MQNKNRTWTSQEEKTIEDYLRANGYVSEARKIFYIATPKVACTSLKWWFASLEGVEKLLENFSESYETDPELVIHDGFMKVAPGVTGLSLAEASHAIFSEDYFRFAVVRNPHKRIFSAWQSKILLQEPLYIRNYSEEEFFNSPIRSVFELAQSYERFLEYLLDNKEALRADYHWTPQVDLLRPDLINYSVIAKVENSDSLVIELSKRLGSSEANPFDGRRANESIIPYCSSFVTARSTEIIKSLYAADFACFDYPLEPPSVNLPNFENQFDLILKAIQMIRGRHLRFSKIIEGREKLEHFTHGLEEQIIQKNSLLAQNIDEIHRLDKLVLEKDFVINAQGADVSRLEAVVLDKISLLDGVGLEVKRLESAFVEKEHAVITQASDIRRLEKILNESKLLIEAKSFEIESLRALVIQKDQEFLASCDYYNKEKEYFYSEIDKRDSELRSLYASTEELRRETIKFQKELVFLKTSRPYRLVRILREMPLSFKKIFVVSKIILGGVLPTSLVNIARQLGRSSNSAKTETQSASGAYVVKAPPQVSLNRPVVVHVIANFMTGGSSRLVVDIVEYLGVQYQHFVLTSLNPYPPAYVGVDIEECRFPHDITPFIEYYKRIKPDFIHVHYWGDCDEPWYAKAMGAAENLGIKVIENINTPVAPFRSYSVSKYVYVSDYVRRVFGEGLENEVIIYPGSDFQLFHRDSSDQAPADCVGMVYRLEHDKLNEDSIRPFIRIAQMRPATKILIVGGGSLLEVYKSMVIDAGVQDNFEFTGYVSYDELPSLYRRMSLFIAPVWKESFGQVSPFAMSMKIPVIGYDIGAIPEIIGTSDLVAPPNNPDELAKIAIRLLDSEEDRRIIGEFQQERAQRNFSVKAMIDNYAEVYSEVYAMACKERA